MYQSCINEYQEGHTFANLTESSFSDNLNSPESLHLGNIEAVDYFGILYIRWSRTWTCEGEASVGDTLLMQSQALIRLHQQAIDIMMQSFTHQNSSYTSLTAVHVVITDRVLAILKVPDQRIVLLSALHRQPRLIRLAH